MIRCLGLILVLAMLLCGCVQQTTPPASSEPAPDSGNTTIVDGSVTYVPESSVEQATSGAVLAYSLKDSGYYGTMIHDGALVLFRQENGEGELILYSTAKMEKICTVDLGEDSIHDMTQMQISGQGMAYFNCVTNEIVFLNPQFAETGRMRMGEDLLGEAWVSPDWRTAYFCKATGIVAMDLQTGIIRTLREQTAVSQKITGIFGDGKAIRCEVEFTEGQTQYLLIDTATGLILHENNGIETLQTMGQEYFLIQDVRGVRSLRFGASTAHQALWPKETDAQPVMLFEGRAMVMVQSSKEQTDLTCYDLATGKRTAAVTLPGLSKVWGMGGADDKVWFFGLNADGEEMLYCWDTMKSPSEDETVYTAPWYTRETPDEAGLAAVKEKATELGKKFGIEILIWKDAAATAPADQFFTEEHMTQLYEYYLLKLENALSVFPKEVFKQGKLQIVLLNQIAGEPAWGTLEQMDCLQFWKGNTPIVALTLSDGFERNVLHGVYLYMEARLLSKSSALYEWFRLNPSGFDYDNNYVTNLNRTDRTYVDGKKPYFIDLFSMSYAKEDRATIFEYACQPGNEELFKNAVLQEKLRRICKGIREAYGLKKVETEFLWEQYNTSKK